MTRPTDHHETSNGGDPPKHSVRVWFGRHAICSFRAEPGRARAYADAMSRRYAGLRITVNGRRYRPGGPAVQSGGGR